MRNIWLHITKRGGWSRFADGIFIIILLFVVIGFGLKALVANAQASNRIILYAFSTQEEVFTQGILPAFKKQWQEETGRNLEIEAVFGPSGTLAGQINLGAPADIAIFSNTHHVNWLKFGRMVRKETQPIVIGNTPMVIVTRPGNPQDIYSYADLTQPNLCLLHADPHSSGAGEWSLLAEYGSALVETEDPHKAEAQLKAIWQNVKVQASSARGALTLFELGAGDALITYEQDARLAQVRGIPLQIVVPQHTIIAQPAAVVIDKNVSRSEMPVVQAFMDFLLSNTGQKIFSSYHMRPVNRVYKGFPLMAQPFTIEDFGGWSHLFTEIVDPIWQEEIKPHLDLDLEPILMNSGE